MKRHASAVTVLLVVAASAAMVRPLANVPGEGRPVVVIFGTTPGDSYYGANFKPILAFQSALAKKILENGDNAVIFCDPSVAGKYKDAVGCANCVVTKPVYDIWSRDFGLVNMEKPAFMRYENNYLPLKDTRDTQKSYKDALKSLGCDVAAIGTVDLALDGGNVVDNFADKAVLTRRVVDDNKRWYTESEIVAMLKSGLQYTDIALVPDLADTTGHSDGMVSFIDTDTLAFTNSLDEDLGATESAVKAAFKDTVKYVYLDSHYGATTKWRSFDSACGLHINALLTGDNLYVPVFGGDAGNEAEGQSTERDERVIAEIQANTSKNVVPVLAPNAICRMGGSVRCLTHAIRGPIAECIVAAADKAAKRKR